MNLLSKAGLNFLLLFSTIVLCVFSASAQNKSKYDDYDPKVELPDLSKIVVDSLTDGQVEDILTELINRGKRIDELDKVMADQGMPQKEITKLKERIEKLSGNKTITPKKDTDKDKDKDKDKKKDDQAKKDEEDDEDKEPKLKPGELPVFGAEYFTNKQSGFAPNYNRPTPLNYVLGPNDELIINVYGSSLVNWNLDVTPEGYILLPGMGKVYVGGKTIESATQMLKAKLQANNYDIGKGTDLSISLASVRSIRGNVNGEVKRPGPQTVSSLSTLLNALYAAGGPNNIGTLRSIELYRNNTLYQRLDLYDYILRGDKSNDVLLQDDDIIVVPPYRVRVGLKGEVKRPAYYEVMPGEAFKDILMFSGGFTEKAYTAQVKAIQLTDKERRVRDINASEFDNFYPLKGDMYIVNPILNRFENRITLEGAVFRPGQYALESGLTLTELLRRADGVKEDAFMERGYITRLKEDNTTEIVSFPVKATLDGTAPPIILQREDVVSIFSIFDLRENYNVIIRGAVRNGGDFPYSEGMNVEDLIIMAGGLSDDANIQRVTVARRVINSDRRSKDSKLADIFEFDIDKDLTLASSKHKLEPYDVVTIYRLPGYVKPRSVTIEGEVMFPGLYTIQNKNERISDLIKRAGGFTADAYLKGASLKRSDSLETATDIEKDALKLKQFERGQERITKDENDLDLEDEVVRNLFVGIDLESIWKKPRSYKDLILEDHDVLNIPRLMQTVKVSGEVLSPVTSVYSRKAGLLHYVLYSGGFTEDALRRKSYVVYANGMIKGTKNFIVFKDYPNVEPGSEIFIPKKKLRKDRNSAAVAQTWVGLTASLASVAAVVFAIINQR